MPLNIDDFLASSSGTVPPEEKDKFGEFLARAGIKPGRPEQVLGELKAAQDADVAEGRLGGAERGFRRMAELITGKQNQQPLEKPQNVSKLMQRVGVEQQLTQPDNALRMEFLREMARGADAQQAYTRALEKEKQARLYKEQDEQSRREWEEQKTGKQQEFQAEQNRLGREASMTAAGIKARGATTQSTTDLRKEFQADPIVKSTKDMAQAIEKIRNVPNTGTGDLSLIYSYVKILDPGSVVREGEIALSREPTPLLAGLVQRYKRAKEGELLPPELRKSYKESAEKLWGAQLKTYENSANQYKLLAERAGLSPGDVVLPLGYAEQPVGKPSQEVAIPRQQGTDGKWYVFKDGAWEAE